MISDTPRTDGFYENLLIHENNTHVIIDHARQLERELTNSRALTQELLKQHLEAVAQRDRMAEAIKRALNSMSDSSYGDRAVTGKARTALTEALVP